MSRFVTRRKFLTGSLVTGFAATETLAGWRRRRCRPAVFCPQPFPPESCPEPSPGLYVRRNILSLTSSQLQSLRQGVAAMKALPDSDRRSWTFQAAIHGTDSGVSDPLFNQCEHGTLQFFTWHRGYLYFFERILRWASGDATLTLPYWDWFDNRVLPQPFRVPAVATNSLYDSTRLINDGSAMPLSAVANQPNALAETVFSDFSSSLEGNPHGSVHGAVGGFGGNMGRVNRAARDPIFWLHHGNVDRLWNYWLSLGGGRLNPSDPGFLNQTYSFSDESGNVVTIRVHDIISSAQLGYRYDNVPNPFAAMGQPAFKTAQSQRVAATSLPVDKREVALADVESKPLGSLPVKVRLNPVPEARAALAAPVPVRAVPGRPARRITVQVEGVSAGAPPNFTYAVYLNLPEGQLSPEQQLKYFLGTINFFGRTQVEKKTGQGHGHGAADTFTETFNASPVIARLQQERRWDPDAPEVTIVPTSPTPPPGARAVQEAQAAEVVQQANIRYKRITLQIPRE